MCGPQLFNSSPFTIKSHTEHAYLRESQSNLGIRQSTQKRQRIPENQQKPAGFAETLNWVLAKPWDAVPETCAHSLLRSIILMFAQIRSVYNSNWVNFTIVIFAM